MTVAENLAAVEARIVAACERSGRPRSSVRLLPVSKTHPASVVLEAYAAGCRRFGENKVQEAAAKAEELASVPDLEWALIGHLQTNKARDVAGFASEFQALDSLRVAAELDRRLQAAGRGLDVLIEVDTSGEESKFGVDPAEVAALARELRAFTALRVRGLMTIAANTGDREVVAGCFDRLASLLDPLRDALGAPCDELSMGMSGDFELAIEHGSTCVRVGTAIFGARDYGVGARLAPTR
jgi:pyridoxal phosphate enzyme (YggS family)